MLLETLSREELINLFKDQLLKCTQSININRLDGEYNIYFSKGHVYLLSICEGGCFLKDDNGNWVDLDELAQYEKIDVDKVFVRL